MEEFFPFATGAVIGLIVQRLRSTQLKVVVFIVLCVICGALASYLAGELSISWWFVSVDMALVWLGALVSVGVVEMWHRRSASVL